MPNGRRAIPKPTPVDERPRPEVPPAFQPLPPGPLRVIELAGDKGAQLAVVYKRTYSFKPGEACVPAEEQIPLDEQGVPYEETGPGRPASFKSLPEVVGLKTGTDVVIQGCARPARALTSMTVEVRVGGGHRHAVLVSGHRVCDYVNGKLTFTPPEPFEEMAIRYENAYGGGDEHFDRTLAGEVGKNTSADVMRRVRPAYESVLGGMSMFLYPRNRFGKGLVIEDRREAIEGKELPNLEWPDDRLIPARLVVGGPFNWMKQPLPAGFDYLDPMSFPRSAMIGLPPAGWQAGENIPEVSRKLIPADYCRGNMWTVPPAEVSKLLHPMASRCASLGLWLPMLRGDGEILLLGMDPRFPELRVVLPGERPDFSVAVPGLGVVEMGGELLLVTVNVDDRTVCAIWSGRVSMAGPLMPGKARELIQDVRIKMVKV